MRCISAHTAMSLIMRSGGIVQPFELIEVAMIQCGVKWRPRVFDVGVVDQPTGVCADRAANHDLDAVGVSVDPAAFVILGDVRQ